ncbi:hypothetical protein PEC301877_12120 [Pectobacterium carotovorum subsp. carotovorum]|nr:hypothetical protein PEC301877_12120 [Pectobacterium carotovorum subsp. carotovorum]
MPAYANRSGNSRVVFYETTADSIRVEFKDGWKYVYNANKLGTATASRMKELAHSGQGLNSYISSVVKKNFQVSIVSYKHEGEHNYHTHN